MNRSAVSLENKNKAGSNEMSDIEFEQLEADLEATNEKLQRLQKIFFKETGRRWIPTLYMDRV